jgi:hypothetical protein
VEIPPTGETYIAYGGKTFRIKEPPGNGWIDYARVETDPIVVGPGAPFDSTVTAQEGAWPETKVILYHENKLWVINDYLVRWSGEDADVIGHNVWPSLNFEYLQGDNSPTVGAISAWGRVYVFKQNSIYASTFMGIDESFGNPIYSFQRIVSGKGAVASNAIWLYENKIGFLSEDGVYSLSADGVPRRLSMTPSPKDEKLEVDRLTEFFKDINPAYRSGAAAIDWTTKGVSLISVPSANSVVNDKTLVHDYRNDAFWIWEGFNAQYWAKDTDVAGNEALYFGSNEGYIYQFGVGTTDHGAPIDAYTLTQAMGAGLGMQFILRRVNIDATNDAGKIAVGVYADDNLETPALSSTMTFSNWREASYDSGLWGVAIYVAQRMRRKFNTFSKVFRNVALKVSPVANTGGSSFKISKIEAEILPINRRP